MHRSADNRRGILWMVGAATAFTGLYVAVRELGGMLPTFEILFFRSVFTMALMAPWLLRLGRAAFRTARPGLHLLRGCSTFAAMSMMFFGVAHSPLADASALQSTYPLFTIGLAMLLVGLVGILVIVRPGFAEIGLPTLALLGCSVFYAISKTVVKLMAGTDHPTQMVFSGNFIVPALSLAPTAVVWQMPPVAALPWIVLLGATGYAAHMCLTRALRHGEASVVMPFDYLRLPFAALVGFWLYREVPNLPTVLGAAIIVASVTCIAAVEARGPSGRRPRV